MQTLSSRNIGFAGFTTPQVNMKVFHTTSREFSTHSSGNFDIAMETVSISKLPEHFMERGWALQPITKIKYA